MEHENVCVYVLHLIRSWIEFISHSDTLKAVEASFLILNIIRRSFQGEEHFISCERKKERNTTVLPNVIT